MRSWERGGRRYGSERPGGRACRREAGQDQRRSPRAFALDLRQGLAPHHPPWAACPTRLGCSARKEAPCFFFTEEDKFILLKEPKGEHVIERGANADGQKNNGIDCFTKMLPCSSRSNSVRWPVRPYLWHLSLSLWGLWIWGFISNSLQH